MIEVYPNLWIGSQSDYERDVKGQSHWHVVHACREPYHREALGYTGRGADKNHPEYLIAKRGDRLILNLVDAPDPAYIRKEIVDAAILFIHSRIESGPVLAHCNCGRSRCSLIGLLYLASIGVMPKDFAEAEERFRSLYPAYAPGAGVHGFLKANYDKYTV